MRIVILTLPARGDTEPFIALALKLKSQGHRVRLAARPDVKDLVEDYGIGFVPLGNPYRPFIAGAAMAGAMGPGHPVSKLRYGLRQRAYVTEGLHDDAWKAAQGADAVGFGSMVSGDRAATLKIVLDALKLAGLRGVLLSGWSEIGSGSDLPETVFSAPSIPHSWLFPRMAAVVHHGGAGTTGAGLRAGIPSVICPHLADQPSWARMVHDLGAGPPPISFRELAAPRLAQALRDATTNPAIRQRSAALGSTIRSEDGTGRAAAAILRYARTFQPSSPRELADKRNPQD